MDAVIVAVLVLFALALAAPGIAGLLEVRRLRKLGRTLRWDEAVARVDRGEGFLVLGGNDAPRSAWWIAAKPEDHTLELVIEDVGLLLTDAPPAKARAGWLSAATRRDRVLRLMDNVLFSAS